MSSKRMVYLGPDDYSLWMEHGAVYDVDIHEQANGKVVANIAREGSSATICSMKFESMSEMNRIFHMMKQRRKRKR